MFESMKTFSLQSTSGQADKRTYNCRFVAALVVSALASLVAVEQSQAQLYLHIYPSQDNPTGETVWIFSGSSTAWINGHIRTSGNFEFRDSWRIDAGSNSGNIFNANGPNNANLSLSPLFSSSNTDDIASVRARIPGGGRTNITFAASATNTPTITTGSGSRTIASLFMRDASNQDTLGIRVAGSNLSFTNGQTSSWVGAGILNKPIGDFFAGTFNNRVSNGPDFAADATGSIRLVVNSQIIPEPEEYALVFGLFALGFVFFHRWQKKRQQQATAS